MKTGEKIAIGAGIVSVIAVAVLWPRHPTVVTWNYPVAGQPLLSPDPANGRPYLTTTVDLSEVTASPAIEWFQVAWQDETGNWQYYVPGFLQNDFTTLEPGKEYWVVVSAPCKLMLS